MEPNPQVTINPFVALRQGLGLGQADFARALGISLPALWAAENGTTAHPTHVLKALESVGYQSAELPQVYARWRKDLIERERRRVRGMMADAAERLRRIQIS